VRSDRQFLLSGENCAPRASLHAASPGGTGVSGRKCGGNPGDRCRTKSDQTVGGFRGGYFGVYPKAASRRRQTGGVPGDRLSFPPPQPHGSRVQGLSAESRRGIGGVAHGGGKAVAECDRKPLKEKVVMLIGFSKHGTGEGAQPIRYLTAETVSTRAVRYLTGEYGKKGLRRDPQPVVVRGDPVQTRVLIDSLKFKNKYTSGVMSFAPGEVITQAMERYIMDEFERVAFAGLNRDQYTVLFVRHTHTASHRHEIHFVVPRVELCSGRSLNVAPPAQARAKGQDLMDSASAALAFTLRAAFPNDGKDSSKYGIPFSPSQIGGYRNSVVPPGITPAPWQAV
jgi:hypothetical protein